MTETLRTIPRLPLALNCRGRLLSLARPVVMAIVNRDPASFYDGARAREGEAALVDRVGADLTAGAAIIDVGGASSRPGAAETPEQLELERAVGAIAVLAKAYPDLVLSVDTYRASVAREALRAGAAIVNDISGGTADPAMWDLIARTRAPFIAMHRAGASATMQEDPQYPAGVTETVYRFFTEVIARAQAHAADDIVLDPGFGFGKTDAHNFELLARLRDFRFLRRPLLVGLSRKSMLRRTTGRSTERASHATTAAHVLALQGGADILRVHDVAPARDAIAVVEAARAHDPYSLPAVPLV